METEAGFIKTSSLGRPVTESGLFKKELVSFIEKETSLRQNGKPSFRVEVETTLSRQSGDKHKFLVHCGGGIDMVNTILVALESEEKYLKRIVSFENNIIHISENECVNTIIKNDDDSKIFIERLRMELAKYPNMFDAKMQTSFIVAARMDPLAVRILFKTDDQAKKFVEVISNILKTQKDGKVVKITIKRQAIKGFFNTCKHILLIKGDPSKGLIASPIDTKTNQQPVSYVHMSTDYNEFHFLPFNRKVTKKHVMELVVSMDRHGVTSFPTIVITNCIDGTLRKWIVDGQNRFEALKYGSRPILYTVTTANSKKEIVRLIADLNKTSRRWVTRNFLEAWYSLDIEDYNVLKNSLERTKLPITLLFEIFTNQDRKSATVSFQNGEFEISDKEKSLLFIEHILSIKKYVPKTREIFAAFVEFFRQKGNDYNHQHMIGRLISYKDRNVFVPGDTRKGILNKINKIYD